MYIPPGFNTVTPYIFVKDADHFVEFLLRGLDGFEIHRSLRQDGGIANAQIAIGTSTLMVSECSKEYPAMPGSYYLYVENADESVARALNYGATLIMTVADMPYGDRQGGVRDAFGNLWWISQRLVKGGYQA